jgi:hypothetical protein
MMARLPQKLRPKNFGDFSVEPFDVWSSRLASALPSNVPRDLLESWLYRHWEQVQGDLDWLPLKKLRFEEQELSDEDILALRYREDADGDWLVHWGEEFLKPGTSHNRMWIGQQVMELRTYPVKPLVLDPTGVTMSYKFVPGAPLYLIEGHMRTAFVRALARAGMARPPHVVWVARL